MRKHGFVLPLTITKNSPIWLGAVSFPCYENSFQKSNEPDSKGIHPLGSDFQVCLRERAKTGGYR